MQFYAMHDDTLVVGNSKIAVTKLYSTTGGTVGNYYDFVLDNIKRVLLELQPNVFVNFGCFDIVDADISINIQLEQAIYSEDDVNYFTAPPLDPTLRHLFSMNDLVVEFTATNMQFLSTVLDSDTFKKLVYVPNLRKFSTPVYDGVRQNNIATFHNINPRRADVLKDIPYDNFNIFDLEQLKQKLDSYKILLNTHQNYRYKTFNDLRCAPMFQTGILIVSETAGCPYLETIPYYKHIVWCESHNLKQTIVDVLDNYDEYRTKYLNGLSNTFEQMYNTSYSSLKQAITNVLLEKQK